MFNRRTFLKYFGYTLSLPISSKFGWLTKNDATPFEDGSRPSDVAELLFRAKRLLSNPSHWGKDIYWEGERCCLLGAIIAEAFLNRKDTPWPHNHFEEGYSNRRIDTDKAFQDDLVHTAYWVINTVLEFQCGYRAVPMLWNDDPSRTHSDVLDLLDKAIAFELSDTFASEVILRTDPEVYELAKDRRLNFEASNGNDPDSITEKAINRVMRLWGPIEPRPSSKIMEV